MPAASRPGPDEVTWRLDCVRGDVRGAHFPLGRLGGASGSRAASGRPGKPAKTSITRTAEQITENARAAQAPNRSCSPAARAAPRRGTNIGSSPSPSCAGTRRPTLPAETAPLTACGEPQSSSDEPYRRLGPALPLGIDHAARMIHPQVVPKHRRADPAGAGGARRLRLALECPENAPSWSRAAGVRQKALHSA